MFFSILILDLILTSPSWLLVCLLFRQLKRSKQHERFKRSGELARDELRDFRRASSAIARVDIILFCVQGISGAAPMHLEKHVKLSMAD